MRIPAQLLLLLFLAACFSCSNEHTVRQHIEQNKALLLEKQKGLSELNYKVTRNSLRVGTSDYDTTISKNFPTLSATLQASIDSLKIQTDSLQSLLSK